MVVPSTELEKGSVSPLTLALSPTVPYEEDEDEDFWGEEAVPIDVDMANDDGAHVELMNGVAPMDVDVVGGGDEQDDAHTARIADRSLSVCGSMLPREGL